MVFGPVTITTRKGITVEIRSPGPEEGQELADYYRRSCGETLFLLSEPEDVEYTAESEARYIEENEKSDDSLILCAYVDGKLAGNCSFSPVGSRARIRHRASTGIALFRDYWHMGIGETLMGIVISKARECGYEILELEVVSSNEAALGLYTKLGFKECGRLRNAMKYRDGTYADFVVMQLFL